MFKPLLSPNNDPLKDPLFFEGLKFPLLCSPKLDGIRCIVKEERCKSRTYTDLPSEQVQMLFSRYYDFDGEIIAGNITDVNVYNRTQSHVMSRDRWHHNLTFNVFDTADEDLAHMPFEKRLAWVTSKVKAIDDPRLKIVEHVLVNNVEELLAYEKSMIDLGYEGVMMRNPHSKYKHGRGTFKEGIIYKLKRFADAEGMVTAFIERETNLNEKLEDNFGRAKRSTHQDNMLGADTLGKFVVEYEGQSINVACGSFSHEECQIIWDNKHRYQGKILKFRHMPHGAKDAPRHARAIGWRTLDDM